MSRDDYRDHVAWIDGRARTLLFHYYQPDRDAALVDAAMIDWIDTLECFSRDLIARVAAEYIRTVDARRPTPAIIHKRCSEIVSKAHFAELPPPPPEPERPPGIAKSHAARIAREICGDDIPEYVKAFIGDET